MQPIPCPSCRQTMSKHRFARLLHGDVVLDLCFACQGIWFDEFESVQLTPGGIIDLFKLLHQHRDQPHPPLSAVLHCPRCDEKLLHGLDVAKQGGQFNYHRCLQKHGRFSTFAQFMIEKGFVRQLNPVEIDSLAAKLGTIRCNGCGAPIDIRREHACAHCAAPIAILDPSAVEQALSRYQQAEVQRSRVDINMLGDAIVAREKEKSRQLREKLQGRMEKDEIGELIVTGAEILWRWLRH